MADCACATDLPASTEGSPGGQSAFLWVDIWGWTRCKAPAMVFRSQWARRPPSASARREWLILFQRRGASARPPPLPPPPLWLNCLLTRSCDPGRMRAQLYPGQCWIQTICRQPMWEEIRCFRWVFIRFLNLNWYMFFVFFYEMMISSQIQYEFHVTESTSISRSNPYLKWIALSR